MPPTTSTPHLPNDFVQQVQADPMMVGFESVVFSAGFNKDRLLMIDANAAKRLHPDNPMISPDGRNLTYLHLAATLGDPLLLCEMIRLGSDPNVKDPSGKTALFLALESYERIRTLESLNSMGRARLSGSIEMKHILPRVAFGAACLIKQHADVNISIGGVTPLHKACFVKNWDLISLLLEHGAKSFPSTGRTAGVPHPMTFLSSDEDKSRFSNLVQSFSPSRPRPPRMCPCFSQKTLDQCHKEGTKPYPSNFPCICASGKTYAACSCTRRKLTIVESWVEDRIRVAFSSVVQLDTSTLSDEEMKRLEKNVDSLSEVYSTLGILPDTTNLDDYAQNQARKMADKLCAEGLVDPAYRFAMHQVDFAPRPQGLTINKQMCRQLQKEWNGAVDKYIALGTDKRSKAEIERAAKIGLSNGALNRRCDGCFKQEGDGIEGVKKCSRCKIAVYCSPECQNAAWPAHKEPCKKSYSRDEYLREQALPSQAVLYERTMADCLEGITSLDLTPPPEIRYLMHAMRTQKAQ